MPKTEFEKFKPDSAYDLDRYASWSVVPKERVQDVSFLLGEVPWLKKGLGEETTEFLNETLSSFQEKLWLQKNGRRDRKQASIIFLPEQPNIAYHSEFKRLGSTQVVEPTMRHFDGVDEWVIEGLTKKNLGWDIAKKEKIAYVIGKIQGPPDLMNLMQVTQGLKDLGAEEITFLCPYLGWTRQDRPNKEKGQPVTIAAVMEIVARQVDRMATMDAHSIETARLGLKDKLAFCSFSGWKYLLEILKSEGCSQEGLVVIGPDLGRRSQSARIAQLLGVPLVSLCKQRDSRGVLIQPLGQEQQESLSGREAIIFDDVIASAGTTSQILEVIKPYISSLTIIASHALLMDMAIARLSDPKIRKVIFTDSRGLLQEPPANDKRFLKVSCVPPLADFLRHDIEGNFNPWQHVDFKDIVQAV